TAAAPDFAIDPHAIAQSEPAYDLGSDKDVLRCLDKISFRIVQEAKPFAGNFNDAFAKFRFALNRFAGFDSAFSSLSAARRAVLIESLDGNLCNGVIGVCRR